MEIVSLILMGGKSSRMQQDKAFIVVDDKPFYQHMIEKIPGFKVYLSVAKKDGYEDLQYPLVIDSIAGVGPIGGIYSALSSIACDALLVLPCDVPRLHPKVVETLYSYWKKQKCTVIIEAENQLHPLIGIYTKDCLEALQQQINSGNYKMMDLLDTMEYATITPKDLPNVDFGLYNINSPGDIHNLK